MATFLYGVTSEAFAEGTLGAWETLSVYGALVNSLYTPKANTDQLLSDIPAAAVIATAGPMTSMASVNGICAGILPQFNSLLSAVPAAAIVLYNHTTSQLIYYSSDGIGFPLLLQGFNYAVAFDQQLGGWFQV